MKSLLTRATLFCGLLLTVESVSAQVWTQTMTSNFNWSCVASSADGTKLVAVASANSSGLGPGFIYTSTNSGSSWTRQTNGVPGNIQWVSVASSADGVGFTAAGAGNTGAGMIIISRNSGTTWANTSAPQTAWQRVASSSDGTKLVAVSEGIPNEIYTSTNSGMNWNFATNSALGSNGYLTVGIACSADGVKMATAFNSGWLLASTNTGTSWQAQNFSGVLPASLTSSADGSELFLLMVGYLYSSTNWGVTWTTNVAPTTGPIVCSADASRLVMAQSIGLFTPGGAIYTSTNLGVTWKSTGAPNYIGPVASSADGNKLVAIGSPNSTNSGIWISDSFPRPQLNLAPSSNGLAFSWLVPSTNFVLQENSDLTASNWVILTNTPTLNLSNLNDEVVLSPTNRSGFFRLMSR